MKKDVFVVCGTRPEIIKMAPVYLALKESKTLNPVLVHSGQHTDLATPLYEFFEMNVNHNITLTRDKPTLTHLSAKLLDLLGDVVEAAKPSAVLVHGDTSTAAMAALAAFYQQIPVGHVEAGLRTGDKYSPFPEEMNRSVIGRIANWHYAPTSASQAALLREGVPTKDIFVTGNTVIDAALLTASQVDDSEAFVAKHQLAERSKGKRLVLVTAHRRENWGAGLENISNAVCDMLENHPELLVVWPLHANPAVAASVRNVVQARGLAEHAGLVLCEPLDYTALVWLLKNAWMTWTDSGGIQEEAAALGVPALVLRESTERPELIEAGGGVLVGASRELIVNTAETLWKDESACSKMRNIVNPFGDGTAARQIVAQLERDLA